MQLSKELWKPVAGFDGYFVSDLGRVRGSRGKILSPGKSLGYLQVQLCADGKRTQRKVHQLVLEEFVGPRPARCEARHLNGKRDDCRLENLAWGTKKENAADRMVHGTDLRGKEINTAILSEAKVRKIRAARKAGAKYLDIAERFGTCFANVGRIVRRETWAHI